MKIDTHQHFWHFEPQDFPWISEDMPVLRRHQRPVDSRPGMDNCGVLGLIAVQARCGPQETDFLLELAAHHPHILGVIGWTDLTSATLEADLARWQGQEKLKGFRYLLQDEPDLVEIINNPAFNAGVACLQRRQLVFEVLVFAQQLPIVIDFCTRHDRHALVLDHVGKPRIRDWLTDPASRQQWQQALTQLARLPHVSCKLSGLVTETDWQHQDDPSAADILHIEQCFDVALEAFGPGRLMFGSDWPVSQLAADYQAVHAIAQSWAESRLDRHEQQAFWGANAVRMYGLTI
ncbi:amidohydrolase family protein [Rhodoferax sp.]|uniref:amidohydrolase family protein n=1 Tax=Rhodoferax sp. TaxID=50421 RepID=UPI0025E7AC51|nr:amidohydrolase family protein [Rhodoferax sp.]MCM2341900.1 amidohydrolase family protein [Rhodoferax sp.]